MGSNVIQKKDPNLIKSPLSTKTEPDTTNSLIYER